MGLDDLMSAGDAREREWNRRETSRRGEKEREAFRKQEETSSGPQLALKHLNEVRAVAALENSQAQSEVKRIDDQIRRMSEIESRFVRRRNHFLAAAERNLDEGRQAAELAGTAERLRLGIETLRKKAWHFPRDGIVSG